MWNEINRVRFGTGLTTKAPIRKENTGKKPYQPASREFIAFLSFGLIKLSEI
jgi:hypothetical protein